MIVSGNGTAFTVTGAPIDRDAAMANAGLDVLLTQSAKLAVADTGPYGDWGSTNGFNARLSARF